ncbi:hypothetical protein PEBR_08002 [Penicillium brasilianum]|uniref:Uncharacterized protein n=1 Tax=Penicillium brasilianum TaxID=104259 RepID=A0A1S9RVT6_PENBI|nr:hypothetical protein PEBR_08002 [Penicillium brasilianum]
MSMNPTAHGSILEPCAKNLDVPLLGHKPGPHRFGGWVRKGHTLWTLRDLRLTFDARDSKTNTRRIARVSVTYGNFSVIRMDALTMLISLCKQKETNYKALLLNIAGATKNITSTHVSAVKCPLGLDAVPYSTRHQRTLYAVPERADQPLSLYAYCMPS